MELLSSRSRLRDSLRDLVLADPKKTIVSFRFWRRKRLSGSKNSEMSRMTLASGLLRNSRFLYAFGTLAIGLPTSDSYLIVYDTSGFSILLDLSIVPSPAHR